MSISSSVYKDESQLSDLIAIGFSEREPQNLRDLHPDDSNLLPGKFLEEPHTRPSDRQGPKHRASSTIKSTRILGAGPAAPLMPLRERDVKALAGFFEPTDMAEIEADIVHNLIWLWPEPCWEEDPYAFLREYL